MGTTIGIRLTGTDEKVYLTDFLKAGNDLLDFLTEIDITMSPSYKSTVDWRLRRLSYSSPALLEVEGDTKEDQPDNRASIIETALQGVESLKKSSERPRGFNDKALEIGRDFARLIQNGVKSLEIISEDSTVQYTVSILSNVDIILTPGKQVYGSIEGRIERMNSHGEFNFYLYEPILIRRIRCELMDSKDMALKKKIISLYEKAVAISGLLDTNINGEVTSAKVRDIDPKEVVPLLKDASEVTGIWDLTGGTSPVEYVKEMRDDS